MIEIGKLHHCTIIVNDLEASRDFYINVLGMKQVERPGTFNFPGHWYNKNGYEIHTLHISCTSQLPGDKAFAAETRIDRTRHFCFSVADMDATLATLAEMNVSVAHGPQPRGDGATQLYLYDPDGHLIELVYEPWAQ